MSIKVGDVEAYIAELRAKGIDVDVGPSRTSLPTRRGPHTDGIHAGGERKLDSIQALDNSLTITLPIRTINVTNAREHWAVRKKRTTAEHESVFDALKEYTDWKPRLAQGCVISMRRISPGTLDDDGLRSALKGARDALAIWLYQGRSGQHDSDNRVEWRYEQGKCGRGIHGVVVTLTSSPQTAAIA